MPRPPRDLDPPAAVPAVPPAARPVPAPGGLEPATPAAPAPEPPAAELPVAEPPRLYPRTFRGSGFSCLFDLGDLEGRSGFVLESAPGCALPRFKVVTWEDAQRVEWAAHPAEAHLDGVTWESLGADRKFVCALPRERPPTRYSGLFLWFETAPVGEFFVEPYDGE